MCCDISTSYGYQLHGQKLVYSLKVDLISEFFGTSSQPTQPFEDRINLESN